MSQLNSNYSELFELPSQEELEEEEIAGRGKEDVDGNSGQDSGFTWMGCVDTVSETLRISWHEVYHISVIEFLNILAYCKERNRKEKEALEKWKKK